jgi:hypothetical protein
MIYKNISVKRVISRVFDDLNLEEGSHRISDMIEWAGQAVEKIGAFSSFINKVSGKDDNPLLEVTGYQTLLPHDFHKLIQVSYALTPSGPFYPMRYATGSFDWGSTVNEPSDDGEIVHPESSVVTLAMSLYDLSYEDALTLINNEPATRALLEGMLNAMDSPTIQRVATEFTDTTFDFTYLITPNYIKTNIETGYIMLAYQAIATDAEGYPLVPDNESFIEAIYWYINMKLLYPEWKTGHVRDAVYYDAKRSWNYYCKQAYGDALMPNRDQMESIKNSWLRLVPEIHEHSTGFSTMGQRQLIHNHTK